MNQKLLSLFAMKILTVLTLGVVATAAQAYSAPEYPAPLTRTLATGTHQILFQAGNAQRQESMATSWVVLQNRWDQQREEFRVRVNCTTGLLQIAEHRSWSANRLPRPVTTHAPEWFSPEPGSLTAAVRHICVHK